MVNRMVSLHNDDLYEKSYFVRSLINAFTILLPLVLLTVTLEIIMGFPMASYQKWLLTKGGALRRTLSFFHNVAVNYYAIYVVIAISLCYANLRKMGPFRELLLGMLSLFCFLYLIGTGTSSFYIAYLSYDGTFTALLSCVICCTSFYNLTRWFDKHDRFKTARISRVYHAIQKDVLPLTFILTFIGGLGWLFYWLTEGKTIQACLLQWLLEIHAEMLRFGELPAAIGYLFLQMGMWFFGIHGDQFLDLVNAEYYERYLTQNAVGVGHYIINEGFLQCFTQFGGAGCMMAMIMVIIHRSKSKTAKTVARISFLPCLLNLGDFMIYGLPVVFNVSLVIPFVLTPIVNLLIAYGATAIGLVPLVKQGVPSASFLLVSGYLSTKSINGAVLQLLLLCVDFCIYYPFIPLMDRHSGLIFSMQVKKITARLQKSEKTAIPINLLDDFTMEGDIARMLIADLQDDLREHKLFMVYQPQYDSNGVFMGAEALLRWKHAECGYIYPPLIIKLAQEGGFSGDLERFVFHETCTAIKRLEEFDAGSAKISANVTGESPNRGDFLSVIEGEVVASGIDPTHLWIEVTEQTALDASRDVYAKLQALRRNGHKLLIDDFGMGHTSIDYLQSRTFDGIKLDGRITRDVDTNLEEREIVKTVTSMAKEMSMIVIAEYVERREQRDMLKSCGCTVFQGYYYSKPVVFDELLTHLESMQAMRSLKNYAQEDGNVHSVTVLANAE